MSFRPRPQLLNLGVVSRSRLGSSRGPTTELIFSQLFIPTKSTTRASTRKSRFSTSTTSTPLSNHHHHHRPRSHQHHHHYRQQQQTRHDSTHSNNPNPSNPKNSKDSSTTTTNPSITRLLSRLPRFLHPYLSSLRSSPSSFVVAFLILHEITAVIPGLGLFYLFHYCGGDDDKEEDDKDKEGGKEGSYGKRFEQWVMGWMMELGYSEVMVRKMEGFEKWFKRKGYFGFGKEEGEEGGKKEGEDGEKGGREEGGEEQGRKEQVLMMKKWQSGGDEKYRVLVDAALAYTITKALLPVRIIASVQATPWFARVLGRVRKVFGGGLRK